MSGATCASFLYGGDGNRVKSVMGGVTTYYIGAHFEWTGSNREQARLVGSQRGILAGCHPPAFTRHPAHR